ncbi:MAG: hypothetical protein HC927_10690, partial [Deltaproteobacteria bacterium]|nr:hypothetical protein [Deltaproteobacteria bacterium]
MLPMLRSCRSPAAPTRASPHEYTLTPERAPENPNLEDPRNQPERHCSDIRPHEAAEVFDPDAEPTTGSLRVQQGERVLELPLQ